MKVTSSVRRVRSLIRGIREGTLIPRPEFQRRLVWTNADKLRFLETVLKGFPFPEIYVAAGGVDTSTGEGSELLVDGQQRITTLNHYFSGTDDIRLGTRIPPYAELPESDKMAFLEYEVVIRDLGAMSKHDIVEVFQRINATQYSLNRMEIDNARYQGEFKQLGIQIADNRLFAENRVFSANEIRRMSDVTFALTLIVTIMSTYFNRDDEITAYLEHYNESFEGKDDIAREIEQVIQFVATCSFPRQSRAWKRSDLFTLLVELHRVIMREQMEIVPQTVAANLNDFYHEVNNRETLAETRFDRDVLETYYQASVQGTNDRSNRIRRGMIIAQVILGRSPVEEWKLFGRPSARQLRRGR